MMRACASFPAACLLHLLTETGVRVSNASFRSRRTPPEKAVASGYSILSTGASGVTKTIKKGVLDMSVARTTEIVAGPARVSTRPWRLGIKRACKTLENVTGAWIQDQTAVIKDGKIKEYRVRMKVTFVLKS